MSFYKSVHGSAGIAQEMWQLTDGEFLDGWTPPLNFAAVAIRYEGAEDELAVTLTNGDTTQDLDDRPARTYKLRRGHIYQVLHSGVQDAGTAASTATTEAARRADATLPGVDTSTSTWAAGTLNALTVFGWREP